MAGELVCSDGKIYDLDVVDNCIDKIMETLKKELPKEAHTYEIYKDVLERCGGKLKVKNFKDL